MVDAQPFPQSRTDAKAQARALKAEAAQRGTSISHGAALEHLAHAHGFRDWNTLSAALPETGGAPRWRTGDRISGIYLHQSFDGEILACERLAPDRTRLTIQFDQPVDVVRFSSFSSWRHRITCTIDGEGRSPARLSDGTPHVTLTRSGALARGVD